MTVARQYVLNAAEGRGAALEAALRDLAAMVRLTPGCDGVEILRDVRAPDRFIFVEKWTSIEAHKGAAEHLPKDAFAPVMATIGEKPAATYLEYLQTA